jgi:hypothetical protein
MTAQVHGLAQAFLKKSGGAKLVLWSKTRNKEN